MAQITTMPDPRARYDANGDVLYVSLGSPIPAYVDDDEDGVLLRRAQTSSMPCGVTVIAYAEGEWNQRFEELLAKMSEFLGVSESRLRSAIQSAMSDTN